MRLSASEQGKLAVARSRVDEARQELSTLDDRRSELHAVIADETAVIQHLEARQQRSAVVAEEDVRRAVVALRTFTITTLANKMGVSAAVAKRALQGEIERGIARESAFKMGRTKTYEYISPDSPGAGFVNQQRHLQSVVTPEDQAVRTMPKTSPQRGQEVAGTGRGLTITHQGMRTLVQEAKANGWVVTKVGNGHLEVSKDGRSRQIPSTPSDIRAYENARTTLRHLGAVA